MSTIMVRFVVSALLSAAAAATLSELLKLSDAATAGLILTFVALGVSVDGLDRSRRQLDQDDARVSPRIRGTVAGYSHWIALAVSCVVVLAVPGADVIDMIVLAFGVFVCVETVCRMVGASGMSGSDNAT
jgi:hypothetical protein